MLKSINLQLIWAGLQYVVLRAFLALIWYLIFTMVTGAIQYVTGGEINPFDHHHLVYSMIVALAFIFADLQSRYPGVWGITVVTCLNMAAAVVFAIGLCGLGASLALQKWVWPFTSLQTMGIIVVGLVCGLCLSMTKNKDADIW